MPGPGTRPQGLPAVRATTARCPFPGRAAPSHHHPDRATAGLTVASSLPRVTRPSRPDRGLSHEASVGRKPAPRGGFAEIVAAAAGPLEHASTAAPGSATPRTDPHHARPRLTASPSGQAGRSHGHHAAQHKTADGQAGFEQCRL